jgi:hypothetical protein
LKLDIKTFAEMHRYETSKQKMTTGEQSYKLNMFETQELKEVTFETTAMLNICL